MSKIFGYFIENFSQEYDSLEINVTFGSRLIEKRWRNNRLSAYFIADYLTNILPIDNENEDDQIQFEEVKNAISYIGNELLENAIKFSDHHELKFGIHLIENHELLTAVIFTKNIITAQRAEKFQAFIKELLSADTYQLYIEQIEKTAAEEDSEASGLGLLTILNDYSAKLGWKFDSDTSNLETITVTTLAQIVV